MKKILTEWRLSRNPKEGFVEWLLYRKLSYGGKLFFGLCLWLLWLKYAFNLVFMVRFFKSAVILAIVVALSELGYTLYQKWVKSQS